MRLKRSTLVMAVVLAVVAFLVAYPLFMLLFGSFKEGPPGTSAPFTFDGYVRAYSNVATYTTLWTTLWLGVVRTLLSVALAIFLAWVVTRTDIPWRGTLEVLIWLKFFLPVQPFIIAWALLLAPDVGILNQFLVWLLPIEASPLNVYSYGGIIWVSVLSWAAVLFIIITPAFRGMDASLEESSRLSGAGMVTTLWRITVPLLKPAILGASLLGFIRLLESFEAELFLGYREGIYVYTTKVFELIYYFPIDFPQGMALSTVFLGIIFGLIALQWRLLGTRQYVTVTGRGFATRVSRLGGWRWVIFTIVLVYVIVGTLLPVATLAVGSFMKLFGLVVTDPFTVKHWRLTLGDTRFWPAFKNTMLMGVVAATLGMVFFSFLSYIIVRTKFIGRNALDFFTWLPWGIPGMVLALGFLWAYVGGIPFPFTVYGTLWLMILAMIVRGFPLGVRVMNGAMVQLGNELEESSRVLGASWFYTFRRIVAPLLSPSFIGAWIILFLLSVRDLVTVILLYSPKSRLLSIIMFEYWFGGYAERSLVVGLISTIMVMGMALLARWLGRRGEPAYHG